MLKQEIDYTLAEIEELLQHGARDEARVANARQKVQALRKAVMGGMPVQEVTAPEEAEAEHTPRRRGRGAAKPDEDAPEE